MQHQWVGAILPTLRTRHELSKGNELGIVPWDFGPEVSGPGAKDLVPHVLPFVPEKTDQPIRRHESLICVDHHIASSVDHGEFQGRGAAHH